MVRRMSDELMNGDKKDKMVMTGARGVFLSSSRNVE